jgi:hypothetical protein
MGKRSSLQASILTLIREVSLGREANRAARESKEIWVRRGWSVIKVHAVTLALRGLREMLAPRGAVAQLAISEIRGFVEMLGVRV